MLAAAITFPCSWHTASSRHARCCHHPARHKPSAVQKRVDKNRLRNNNNWWRRHQIILLFCDRRSTSRVGCCCEWRHEGWCTIPLRFDQWEWKAAITSPPSTCAYILRTHGTNVSIRSYARIGFIQNEPTRRRLQKLFIFFPCSALIGQ